MKQITGSNMPIMAHLVLGYPNLQESIQTAEKYIQAGVAVVELQIPFSHPTADGPVITSACEEATRQGVTVQECIHQIRGLKQRYPMQEIIVMSYLNRVFTFGFDPFIASMEAIGVRHLIIPDLPVDSQAATALTRLNSKGGEVPKLVPVLAANTSDERLEKLLAAGFDFFYLMSDFKITGSGFSLHPRLQTMIKKIRTMPRTALIAPRIGIGFGISSPEQARMVAEAADLAIIGSALIQAQKAGKLKAYLESLQLIFNTR